MVSAEFLAHVNAERRTLNIGRRRDDIHPEHHGILCKYEVPNKQAIMLLQQSVVMVPTLSESRAACR